MQALVAGLGSGTILGLAGPVIGYFAGNLLYGLVFGVVVGMLILGGFTVKAIRIAASSRPIEGPKQGGSVEPESVDTATQEPPPQEPYSYELEDSYFKEQSVYIADLARKGVELEGKTFEDCQIFGPAIIAPFYGSWPFYNCTWAEGDNPDNLLWEADLSREKYVGVIGIDTDCTFRRCHFVRVGILVNEENYKRLKAGTTNL